MTCEVSRLFSFAEFVSLEGDNETSGGGVEFFKLPDVMGSWTALISLARF